MESTAPKEKKLSLYQRWRKAKGPQPISDEEIKKHTGKSRAGLKEWADSTPGVGKNHLAGKLAAGEATGLGGMEAGSGFGGWGPSAEGSGPNRGMKFPPTNKESEGKYGVQEVGHSKQ